MRSDFLPGGFDPSETDPARYNGGPAFPFVEPAGPGVSVAPGMSMRDAFAIAAMQGILANSGGPIQANSKFGWGLVNCRFMDVAEMAYGVADAMLKEKSA